MCLSEECSNWVFPRFISSSGLPRKELLLNSLPMACLTMRLGNVSCSQCTSPLQGPGHFLALCILKLSLPPGKTAYLLSLQPDFVSFFFAPDVCLCIFVWKAILPPSWIVSEIFRCYKCITKITLQWVLQSSCSYCAESQNDSSAISVRMVISEVKYLWLLFCS